MCVRLRQRIVKFKVVFKIKVKFKVEVRGKVEIWVKVISKVKDNFWVEVMSNVTAVVMVKVNVCVCGRMCLWLRQRFVCLQRRWRRLPD